jgi:hypothetical protein
MPRYFFDTADGERFHDTEGTDLKDDAAARLEAAAVLAEMLRDRPDLLNHSQVFRIEVRDADGVYRFCVEVVVRDTEVGKREG